MAANALRVAAVFLGELTHGERFRRLVFRKLRHTLGRTRQLFAEQHFTKPVAAQDRAGARRAGLFRQRCGLRQDAAARKLLHAVHAPPVVAAAELHVRNAIVLREVGIQERVIRIEDVQHRAVVLEQVGEETNRLLVHRAAQTGEGWEMAVALLAQFIEVVNVQPGAGELRREPARTFVLQHSTRL